jgi:acyl-CoA thioester hydrolase
MARISIDLPPTFSFFATIPVRITDLNYGGHVGNDTILSIIHEARAQFLKSFDYTEQDFGGVGTIMSDVVINYKNELFYGDVVNAAVAVQNISRASFDIVYVLKQGERIIAEARTGMVCFDYSSKKVVSIPHLVKQRLVE